MRRFIQAKISFKLPAVTMLLGAAAVTIASILAYTSQRGSLEKGGQALLTAVVEGRAHRIEELAGNAIGDLQVAANRASTLRAIKGFDQAWSVMGQNQMETLQTLYVTDNPFPPAERLRLDTAQDTSTWSTVHAQVHPEFRAMLTVNGYADIFLINLDGNLVYSVTKNMDLATNLNDGAYNASGLAQAYQQAMERPQGEFAYADFSPYAPAGNTQASFIAQSVFDKNGERIGVIAYEFAADHFAALTNEADGLGETGEVLIVGPDNLLRANSRFSATDLVMLGEIESAASSAALSGESGIVETLGLHGQPVLAAYLPVNVFGQNWAMIAEQDRSEIYAQVDQLAWMLFASGVAVVLIMSVLSYLYANTLTRPLHRSAKSMAKIADGDYGQDIADTNRLDEIGTIAKTLGDIQTRLTKGKALERASQFSNAAFVGSSSSLMMADENMLITSINPALEKIFEKHTGEFKKLFPDFDKNSVLQTEMDFYHPPEIRERIRNLLRDENNLPYKASITVGESRFTLGISMVKADDGENLGYVVEWVDVTEVYLQKAILSTIEKSQVMVEFSADGKFTTSNSLFLSAVGQDHDTLIGKDLADVFKFDANKAMERGPVPDRLQAGEVIFGTFTVPTAKTGDAVVEGGFSMVTDPAGKPIRILFLGMDVTETRQAIEAAEMRRQEMVQAQNITVEGLRAGLGRLADGDLLVKIEDQFSPEHEQLRQDFNATGEQLLEAIRGVMENADLIRGEATEIASAAEDLSTRTERQAATLEETASALDELTSSVSSAADGATHANELVETARENAETSGSVVREAVDAMGQIEKSSDQISKITGVIDDIAFQTNLLALNAGVEAARAGEAGRGFAVVASEVRALAQRSSDAAREINELISESGGQVDRGVKLVDQAGEALVEIVASVGEISKSVGEIAVSSREQSSGLAEINEAVNQLDQVTQQNAAMFEQTTAASHALTREAELLTKTMGRFQVGAPEEATQADSTLVSAEDFASRVQKEKPHSPEVAVQSPKTSGSNVALSVEEAMPQIEDDWDDF